MLTNIPEGLLEGLPTDAQTAIAKIIDKPVRLVSFDESGRAELEFTDDAGVIRFIYVDPTFVKAAP